MEFARQDFNICIIARNVEKCNKKLGEIKEKTGKVFKSKVIQADFTKLYSIDDYQYIADEL
jgi:short-subunit dehydrogenase